MDAPGASDARKIDTGESEELQVDLTGSRKVTVSKFKGKLYVSLQIPVHICRFGIKNRLTILHTQPMLKVPMHNALYLKT